MKSYSLEKISFGTYLKIMFISSLGMGLMFGILSFLVSLISENSVYITLNGNVITGIKAGICGLALYPLMMIMLFLFFGVFLWLGFFLVMKIKKQIKINIQINDDK